MTLMTDFVVQGHVLKNPKYKKKKKKNLKIKYNVLILF